MQSTWHASKLRSHLLRSVRIHHGGIPDHRYLGFRRCAFHPKLEFIARSLDVQTIRLACIINTTQNAREKRKFVKNRKLPNSARNIIFWSTKWQEFLPVSCSANRWNRPSVAIAPGSHAARRSAWEWNGSRGRCLCSVEKKKHKSWSVQKINGAPKSKAKKAPRPNEFKRPLFSPQGNALGFDHDFLAAQEVVVLVLVDLALQEALQVDSSEENGERDAVLVQQGASNAVVCRLQTKTTSINVKTSRIRRRERKCSAVWGHHRLFISSHCLGKCSRKSLTLKERHANARRKLHRGVTRNAAAMYLKEALDYDAQPLRVILHWGEFLVLMKHCAVDVQEEAKRVLSSGEKRMQLQTTACHDISLTQLCSRFCSTTRHFGCGRWQLQYGTKSDEELHPKKSHNTFRCRKQNS